MSSSGSHKSDPLDTRFSTPAPELDDHRPRHQRSLNPTHRQVVPVLEVHQPTPRRGSTMDNTGLLQVNETLRDIRENSTIARDFENEAAIADDDAADESSISPRARLGSAKHRHSIRRQARLQNLDRAERSRESSSSRSSSSQDSVEAFAVNNPRRRANTVESVKAPSFIGEQRVRRDSHVTAQGWRATLSQASLPQAFTQKADDEFTDDDITYPINEEPGKTFTIDFEELDEFIALCAKGLVPPDSEDYRRNGVSAPHQEKVYNDLRINSANQDQDMPNAILNGENPFEKVLDRMMDSDSSTAELSHKHSEKRSLPAKDKFCLYSSDDQSTISASTLGDFLKNGDSFRDLFDVSEGGLWWLDVQNPTRAELECIRKAFKIHKLTTEDIETQEPREKVELFEKYYFVCFRTFYANKGSEDFLDPVHIYIIVCAQGVLSFSYTDNSHAENVRRRIGKARDFMSLTPDYICYAMIDDIVDSFQPIIREAENESESIEDQVFISRDDDHIALLRQIGECRKRVLNMMRLLGGKADVIKGFAKRCNEQYAITPRGEIGLYLGDIQDHVVTMMSNLGHVEKMLSRSHANYLAQLNVDNILKGNHTNKALTKITVLASIIVPLNIVTGLFGMNVNVPGKDDGGLAWFFGIVGVMVVFVSFCIILARRFRTI
jgi:magnesium transporter